jgi:MFS family permease
MATETFHKGASEYGLLGSIMAIGSLTGALLAARRERPRLRLVIGAALAFGVFATVACLMPTYTLFAIALVPVGVSSLTLMTAANATVQLSVAPEMRGRVLALYMAVFMGGTPLGAPIIGWIGEVLGARWTIGVGGVVAILTAGACLLYLVRSQDLTLRYRLHASPHLQVWTPSEIRREEEREREELREAIAAHQAADTKSAA